MEEVQGEQSAVLDEQEVEAVVEGTPEPEVTLPSDTPEFIMPEKFAGKSAEDIARSYMELEKFKGGETEATQEKEEAPKTKDTPEAEYNKYAEAYDANGTLSELEYSELAAKGYSKEMVDTEISNRNSQKEFNEFKASKQLNSVLEPLGGGTDKLKEVSDWARGNKTEAEVEAFNTALKASPVVAQQAMLKGLYAEYADVGNQNDTILHTNGSQAPKGRGYSTETEFFTDMSNPAYKTDKSYIKAVEAKLAASNTTDWSF